MVEISFEDPRVRVSMNISYKSKYLQFQTFGDDIFIFHVRAACELFGALDLDLKTDH